MALANSIPPVTAKILKTGWCARTIAVIFGNRTHLVRYSPWGLNTEKVFVDEVLAVRRRRNSSRMTHGYRFWLVDRMAELIVAPERAASMFPLIGDLAFMRLTISGEVVYEEGGPPINPEQWSTGRGGFPVICASNEPRDQN